VLTLSYGGDSVVVNFDASDVDMQSALESMPSVGRVEVSRTAGSNGQYTWLVTFRALLGNIDLLGVDFSLLFGSNAAATVKEIVPGNGQTLEGYNPRLNVEKVISGRPDYTGRYSVDIPGQYQLFVSQLTVGGLTAQYWDNQVPTYAILVLVNKLLSSQCLLVVGVRQPFNRAHRSPGELRLVHGPADTVLLRLR
jgi:hypothetical protein